MAKVQLYARLQGGGIYGRRSPVLVTGAVTLAQGKVNCGGFQCPLVEFGGLWFCELVWSHKEPDGNKFILKLHLSSVQHRFN